MKERILINKQSIEKLDKSNMFQTLLDFPKQVEKALEISDSAKGLPQTEVKDYLVLGMGGSAIGGSLLSSYVSSIVGLKHLNVRVNRDYNIPGNIDEHVAVIASSYSGGTEETISGLHQAAEITKNIICITTGGELGKIAEMNSFEQVEIPSGMMPRCALGYSFFPMLGILLKSSSVNDEIKNRVNDEIIECISTLQRKADLYSALSTDNPAIIAAKNIHGKIPVIYSSNTLDSVNLRWRCQIQENAKNLSFGHVLPEMNHNEINSWSNPSDTLNKFSVIILNDISDNDKINARFDAVESILLEAGIEVQKFSGEGSGILSRMFDLIYLGDWTSYYLAILNNEDPTPIPLISRLKELLSK